MPVLFQGASIICYLCLCKPCFYILYSTFQENTKAIALTCRDNLHIFFFFFANELLLLLFMYQNKIFLMLCKILFHSFSRIWTHPRSSERDLEGKREMSASNDNNLLTAKGLFLSLLIPGGVRGTTERFAY